MNNYLDLTDIDQRLGCILALEPIGTPEISVCIGSNYSSCKLFKPVLIEVFVDLIQPFAVTVELTNKIYDANSETAVIIKSLQVDGLELIPRFNSLASYRNDHHNNDPTNYLGFNGKWTLTVDRPFYQWLHQATGQGWLLS